jgi:hypothetical protein
MLSNVLLTRASPILNGAYLGIIEKRLGKNSGVYTPLLFHKINKLRLTNMSEPA